MATALKGSVGSVGSGSSVSLRQGETVWRSKPCGGRPRQNLTGEQEKERLTPFLEPAAAGACWWWPRGQPLRKQPGGRSLHHALVYRALPRQGWRPMAPRPKHPPANEEAGAAFKKLTRTRLRAGSRPDRSRLAGAVMLQDEARFGRISDPRRGGVPAGMRPEASRQVVRQYP
jgi:transposase